MYNQELQKLKSKYLGDIDLSKYSQMKNDFPFLKKFEISVPEFSWNKGVETTFELISKSPSLLRKVTAQVIY